MDITYKNMYVHIHVYSAITHTPARCLRIYRSCVCACVYVYVCILYMYLSACACVYLYVYI